MNAYNERNSLRAGSYCCLCIQLRVFSSKEKYPEIKRVGCGQEEPLVHKASVHGLS